MEGDCMEKKEFFDKAEKALNQAFEAAKKSAKLVAEKAGEAAHVTQLLVEKASLEHRVNQEFTRLGGLVYEKAARQGKESFLKDDEIQRLVGAVQVLETQLSQVERSLESERKQKKVAKSSPRS